VQVAYVTGKVMKSEVMKPKRSLILYLLSMQCGGQQTIADWVSVLIGCPAAGYQ